MRISDWSSDVCSSDLSITPPKATRQNAETVGGVPASSTMMPLVPMIAAPASIQASALGSLREWVIDAPAWPRRARSEERRVGTECSVRVDPGGRRIIKKKKKSVVVQSEILTDR